MNAQTFVLIIAFAIGSFIVGHTVGYIVGFKSGYEQRDLDILSGIHINIRK